MRAGALKINHEAYAQASIFWPPEIVLLTVSPACCQTHTVGHIFLQLILLVFSGLSHSQESWEPYHDNLKRWGENPLAIFQQSHVEKNRARSIKRRCYIYAGYVVIVENSATPVDQILVYLRHKSGAANVVECSDLKSPVVDEKALGGRSFSGIYSDLVFLFKYNSIYVFNLKTKETLGPVEDNGNLQQIGMTLVDTAAELPDYEVKKLTTQPPCPPANVEQKKSKQFWRREFVSKMEIDLKTFKRTYHRKTTRCVWRYHE